MCAVYPWLVYQLFGPQFPYLEKMNWNKLFLSSPTPSIVHDFMNSEILRTVSVLRPQAKISTRQTHRNWKLVVENLGLASAFLCKVNANTFFWQSTIRLGHSFSHSLLFPTRVLPPFSVPILHLKGFEFASPGRRCDCGRHAPEPSTQVFMEVFLRSTVKGSLICSRDLVMDFMLCT